MPLEDQLPERFWRPGWSKPDPEPVELVRRTCPKVTPLNRPRWVSKKEAVGGGCIYIDPAHNLRKHWRAENSRACPCHVEAYEGPDSTAGMRVKRTRKKTPRVAVMLEFNTMWIEREPF
jgi:hypothetical protein